MFDNIFGDIFGVPFGVDVKELERELYVLYKTDSDRYRQKLVSIKRKGYKVMRNKEGFHKVIAG